MSEKLKVSREVAEALKKAEETTQDDLLVVVRDISKGNKYTSKCFLALNELSFSDILKIYKYGYEIEETPEEKLLATYELQLAWSDTNDIFYKGVHTAYAGAIVYTLDTLGIKIKGIND